MIPFVVCLVAFGIVLIGAQLGARSGAFLALSGMLGAILGYLVACRSWFLICRAVERTETPVLWHTLVIFWSTFCFVPYLVSRARQAGVDSFESTRPSVVNRLMGWVFGMVSGAVIALLLMMTVTIAASQYWPAYQPAQLPLPVDHWAEDGYRFVETKIAGVPAKDAGHTLLPKLDEKGVKGPVDVWR